MAVEKPTFQPTIEISGGGEQTRSFNCIDNCLAGIYKSMRSDYHESINLRQDRMATINDLAGINMDITGVQLGKKHVDGQ